MDMACMGSMALGVASISQLVRAQFPYFSGSAACHNPVFMENAGGTQCPEVVIDAISDYMRQSYVQLDAGYGLSKRATGIVAAAHDFMKDYMNGREAGEVAFGASSSQLLMTLSQCYAGVLDQGDEIIVQESNHEANAAPWVRLASMGGFKLKIWPVDYETFGCSLDSLEGLLSPRTRIVAVAHVSNLLGEILELEKVVRLVKEKTGGKGRIVADGVAFAPHRALDVQKWGVDWYVFSSYKVYGPHMAVLFGTHQAFADLEQQEGPNFYFIPRQNVRYKFELGCINHESCAGVLALGDYLRFLARLELEGGDESGEYSFEKDPGSSTFDREVVEAAFKRVILLEEPLQMMLLAFLRSKTDVIVLGPLDTDVQTRVPTVSFIHKTKTSSEICRRVQSAGFAIRNGHMYAHRLITGMYEKGKLCNNSIREGALRVSMVHYNTPAEVEALIECLETILGEK